MRFCLLEPFPIRFIHCWSGAASILGFLQIHKSVISISDLKFSISCEFPIILIWLVSYIGRGISMICVASNSMKFSFTILTSHLISMIFFKIDYRTPESLSVLVWEPG
ncbi:hypothetical protein S83_051699 [Arachis hypogaea]